MQVIDEITKRMCSIGLWYIQILHASSSIEPIGATFLLAKTQLINLTAEVTTSRCATVIFRGCGPGNARPPRTKRGQLVHYSVRSP